MGMVGLLLALVLVRQPWLQVEDYLCTVQDYSRGLRASVMGLLIDFELLTSDLEGPIPLLRICMSYPSVADGRFLERLALHTSRMSIMFWTSLDAT